MRNQERMCFNDSRAMLRYCGLLCAVSAGVWQDKTDTGTAGYADKLENVTFTFQVWEKARVFYFCECLHADVAEFQPKATTDLD